MNETRSRIRNSTKTFRRASLDQMNSAICLARCWRCMWFVMSAIEVEVDASRCWLLHGSWSFLTRTRTSTPIKYLRWSSNGHQPFGAFVSKYKTQFRLLDILPTNFLLWIHAAFLQFNWNDTASYIIIQCRYTQFWTEQLIKKTVTGSFSQEIDTNNRTNGNHHISAKSSANAARPSH